ncbi:hypothetical protein ILUMI_16515 [Ignelater luminosus]|uniref:C2H2-type domain-containing protein n=1 Tax=Ignelater luminosus TaxID=2038154 RepID=A0A8K0CLM9_IGNLU|nr:hypothetical protein ILUMI_16515 [Ignelater luminosus]
MLPSYCGQIVAFPCPRCGREYKHKTSLQRHLRYYCGKESKYACKYCGHKTNHEIALLAHYLSAHEDFATK